MAEKRIPLIVDTTQGQNKIRELPVGDELDLTGSNLVGVNSIQTQAIQIGEDAFTLEYS